MSGQSTHREVAALRVWTQRLEEIQRQFSEPGSPVDRPRTAAGSATAAEIPLEDWDALLSAVKYRLRATVSKSPIPRFHCDTASWQASVLECVDELDHLQATLSQALDASRALARREPHSLLPELLLVDSRQLALDLGSGTAAPPATGAAGLGSPDT